MESRIPFLQDDALIIVQRAGVHLPRTFKMKGCLYSGGNFRKKKKKILRKKKSVEKQ